MKWNFLFRLFTAGVQAHYWILCVDLVFCNFTKFIYFLYYTSFLINSLEIYVLHIPICYMLYNIYIRYMCYIYTYTYNMLPVNKDDFTSSFPTWIIFISFFLSIAVAKTSNIMLNSSGKSRQTFHVPHLREKTNQSLTIKYDVCCGYKGFVLCRKVT